MLGKQTNHDLIVFLSGPMQAQDRDRILGLAAELERHNPLPDATRHLDRVAGRWRLLFSTITILVWMRTLCEMASSCATVPAQSSNVMRPERRPL